MGRRFIYICIGGYNGGCKTWSCAVLCMGLLLTSSDRDIICVGRRSCKSWWSDRYNDCHYSILEESNKESKEQTENKEINNENKVDNNNKNVKEENTSETNSRTENNTNSKQVNNKKEEKEISFVMPVEGEIIKGFAKDSLVYSETLQEWVTHQAIDIKAESRDVVKAVANGTVTAIKNDPRYGLTVIIEHDGGFKTVYSNLLTAEFVVEGEQVKQGQTLGTIGNSATFEIADESHLHFEMLKDLVYVDPTIYIK